ncbi:MAG: hypothetical protein ABH883_06845 [Candidatus Omnitrophota bacterium]
MLKRVLTFAAVLVISFFSEIPFARAIFAAPCALSPDIVSACNPMTDDDRMSGQKLISDINFLEFAIYLYRDVIEKNARFPALSTHLDSLPFWEGFRYKSFLEKKFINIKGDMLIIKIKGGRGVRVVPRRLFAIDEDNGRISDGIAPDLFCLTEEFLVQYFDVLPDGTQGTEKEKEAGNPLSMISYGPLLNYSLLDIAADFKGLYLEMKDGCLTCGVEGEHSPRTDSIAEMLEQVLTVMTMEMQAGTNIHGMDVDIVKKGSDLWDAKVKSIGNRRIWIESAHGLKANSANYFLFTEHEGGRKHREVIVFNDSILRFIFDRWNFHRIIPTKETFIEEIGALWMAAEMVFHEVGHAPDEVTQILQDRIFYKAFLNRHGYITTAVKTDVNLVIYDPDEDKIGPFGDIFRTNAYFSMIHSIADMPDTTREDMDRIENVIREYLRNSFRENSAREKLGLSNREIHIAKRALKKYGISDSLFEGRIRGMEFEEFFRVHGLFSGTPPVISGKNEKKRAAFRLTAHFAMSLAEVKSKIVEAHIIAGLDGKKAVENITMALSNEKGTPKQKLRKLIFWAAKIFYPHNFERRSGKLFGRIYYEGLNLFTIPIFPVNDKGEINWELMKWMRCGPKDNIYSRTPGKKYFVSRKISIYEYILSRRLFDPGWKSSQGFYPAGFPKTKGGIKKTKHLYSRDRHLNDEITPDLRKLPFFPQLTRVHHLIEQVNTARTAGKVTHIIIDTSIISDFQKEAAERIESFSKGGLVSEKIIFLDNSGILRYLESEGCTIDNTVIFLKNARDLKTIGKGLFRFLVSKEREDCFVNMEGIIGFARSILNREWKDAACFYEDLTHIRCPEILTDPERLAYTLKISIPAELFDVNYWPELNRLQYEYVTSA